MPEDWLDRRDEAYGFIRIASGACATLSEAMDLCVCPRLLKGHFKNGLCAAAISSTAGGVEALKSKHNYGFDKIRLSSSMLVGFGKK